MSSNQGFNPPRVVHGRGNATRRRRSNSSSQQASSSTPSTIRSAHLLWTIAMDTIILNVLLEDFISRGRQSSSTFKGPVLNAAATAVGTQMVDIDQPVTGANVRSRMITLRKEYKLAKDAMECSGFNIIWDDENKYITADLEAWLKYIEVHPRAANLRHKIFPQFDILKQIYANDTAGREENISGFDSDAVDATVESVGATLLGDEEVETNVNGAEHEGQDEGTPLENDLPPRQDNDINRPQITPTNPKRRRRVDESFAKDSETLQVIAQGVQAIVSTLTGTDMTTIFPVLNNLEGLSRAKKIRAYTLLAKDKCLATCFLGLEEGDKLEWLLLELERDEDMRNYT